MMPLLKHLHILKTITLCNYEMSFFYLTGPCLFSQAYSGFFFFFLEEGPEKLQKHYQL